MEYNQQSMRAAITDMQQHNEIVDMLKRQSWFKHIRELKDIHA
jgi:hypothetical protein